MTHVHGDFGCCKNGLGGCCNSAMGLTPTILTLPELLPEAYAAAETQVQKEKARLWWEQNKVLIFVLAGTAAAGFAILRA